MAGAASSPYIYFRVCPFLDDIFDLCNYLEALNTARQRSIWGVELWKPARESIIRWLETWPERVICRDLEKTPYLSQSHLNTDWPRRKSPHDYLYLPSSTIVDSTLHEDLSILLDSPGAATSTAIIPTGDRAPGKNAFVKVKRIHLKINEERIYSLISGVVSSRKISQTQAFSNVWAKISGFINRVTRLTSLKTHIRLNLTMVASGAFTRITFPLVRRLLQPLAQYIEGLTIIMEPRQLSLPHWDMENTIASSDCSSPQLAPIPGPSIESVTSNYSAGAIDTIEVTTKPPPFEEPSTFVWSDSQTQWVNVPQLPYDIWRDGQTERLLPRLPNLFELTVIGAFSIHWLAALGQVGLPRIRVATMQCFTPRDLLRAAASADIAAHGAACPYHHASVSCPCGRNVYINDRFPRRGEFLDDFFHTLGPHIHRVNLVLPDSDYARHVMAGTVSSLTRILSSHNINAAAEPAITTRHLNLSPVANDISNPRELLQQCWTTHNEQRGSGSTPQVIAFVPLNPCGWWAQRYLLSESHDNRPSRSRFSSRESDPVQEADDYARFHMRLARHIARASEIMLARADLETSGGWTSRDPLTKLNSSSSIIYQPLDFIFVPEVITSDDMGNYHKPLIPSQVQALTRVWEALRHPECPTRGDPTASAWTFKRRPSEDFYSSNLYGDLRISCYLDHIMHLVESSSSTIQEQARNRGELQA